MRIDADLASAASYLDLREVPFTQPGSRLLVRREGTASLTVSRAEYEVPLAKATVLSVLRVEGVGGLPHPVGAVHPDRIEVGPFSVVVNGDCISVAGPVPGTVVATTPEGALVQEAVGAGEAVVLELPRAGWTGLSRDTRHAERLAACRAWWEDWFATRPQVHDDLTPIATHQWWVLGVNQVTLAAHEGTAVVPSKMGYVGLWQWDAYFIAIGLRHTRLELALGQLDLALRHAHPSGQLPDVVHDLGVLRTSDDLPPADLLQLRQRSSPASDPDRAVPLTKPPLAALALSKLVEAGLHLSDWSPLLPAVIDSQNWWLTQCVGADGLPRYDHPYSSGLDDSPVFDADLPVAAPDLAAYLELRNTVLADLLEELQRPQAAQEHRIRAARSREVLHRLWHESQGRFAAQGLRGQVAAHTIVDLLPLLTGTLAPTTVDALVADLGDPATFGGEILVPTVSRTDPSFDPTAMWRGPVWVSTNWLLVEGLERSGRQAEAARLASRTLQQIVASGGAFEYLDADTGRRPARAVVAFGWTAALFLDLAVRYAPGVDADPALAHTNPSPHERGIRIDEQ